MTMDVGLGHLCFHLLKTFFFYFILFSLVGFKRSLSLDFSFPGVLTKWKCGGALDPELNACGGT